MGREKDGAGRAGNAVPQRHTPWELGTKACMALCTVVDHSSNGLATLRREAVMWQMAYKVVLLRVYDSPAFDAAAAIDAKKS
eukprot:gene401-48203_t